ncbi:MAG: dihydrolipoamide dehydrogenase [Alphaproteobacteria bacterium]|nr:dihydrolipoamide dehydrogenase [Alphaproteobacteria bacterium]
MTEVVRADLCIIGAGSGGLSFAAGAAQLGRNVVLIERHKMGGDCLNYGCVPSKALIAAAQRAQTVRDSAPFGVTAGEPKIDFPRVIAHVREVIAAIEPNDSVERFEKLGVRVIKANARFKSSTEVEAGEFRVQAKRFIVAAGSSPLVPPIPGLAEAKFFTNETIFDNEILPYHLLVIGGGPIGIELAQAYRRLGSRVTVLEAKQIMPKDDAEAVAVVRDTLSGEGVTIRENCKVVAVSQTSTGPSVQIETATGPETVSGSHLLLAVGRSANVADLSLEAAGVEYTRTGVTVDRRLRSSNPRVYAIGDVAGGLQFTHVAGYHAALLVRSLLFKVSGKVDTAAIPWCTYTDPEVAQAGFTEAAARERFGKIDVTRWPVHDNDRAQAERVTRGFIKVITARGARVVGATIVAPNAGDLILPWVLAIGQKFAMSTMAAIIAPYPTISEISKRVAGAYYTPTLFSARTKRLVRWLSALG